MADKKKIGFVADADMLQSIKEQAAKRGITQSDLMREALTRHLALGNVLESKELQIKHLNKQLETTERSLVSCQRKLSSLKSRGFWERVFNKGVS